MKLSVEEYIDYSHLCILETLLEKSVEFQRLNLPSRDVLLGEVKGELRRFDKLDRDRRIAATRSGESMAHRIYGTWR
jgi:hypothetical protein